MGVVFSVGDGSFSGGGGAVSAFVRGGVVERQAVLADVADQHVIVLAGGGFDAQEFDLLFLFGAAEGDGEVFAVEAHFVLIGAEVDAAGAGDEAFGVVEVEVFFEADLELAGLDVGGGVGEGVARAVGEDDVAGEVGSAELVVDA